jgi:hypothetical protein
MTKWYNVHSVIDSARSALARPYVFLRVHQIATLLSDAHFHTILSDDELYDRSLAVEPRLRKRG